MQFSKTAEAHHDRAFLPAAVGMSHDAACMDEETHEWPDYFMLEGFWDK